MDLSFGNNGTVVKKKMKIKEIWCIPGIKVTQQQQTEAVSHWALCFWVSSEHLPEFSQNEEEDQQCDMRWWKCRNKIKWATGHETPRRLLLQNEGSINISNCHWTASLCTSKFYTLCYFICMYFSVTKDKGSFFFFFLSFFFPFFSSFPSSFLPPSFSSFFLQYIILWCFVWL